jgi:sodium-dependent dicarboxylate transporter 2/3/5
MNPTPMPPGEAVAPTRWIGLILGPLAAALLSLLLPEGTVNQAGELVGGLTHAGRLTVAVGAWLSIWWLTEAIPIEAAGLLPLAVFPVLGVASIRDTAAPYANEVIFLFMGGLFLGAALERWGLHKRIALRVMLLVGARPDRLVGGIMLATALISMWVSNTATAVMMLPIAVSVVRLIVEHASRTPGTQDDLHAKRFAVAAMLAVAYGASIGGVATIIGTPPNGVLAAFVKDRYADEISFAEWLKVGLPLVAFVLPVAWLLLTRVLFPMKLAETPDARALLLRELRELGPMSRGEWLILAIFSATALAWIFRVPLAEALGLTRPRPGRPPETLLSDAGIAIASALLMFAIPVDRARGVFLLDWKSAGRVPWGVLLLFGGGLSLADAVEANRVDDAIATLLGGLAGVHPVLIILAVTTAAVFISEIGSNTAVVTTFLPIVAVVAAKLGIHPYLLAFPVTIAASYAFMMPSGTPPNALVFSSGYLHVRDMVKAGFWLNLISIAAITALFTLAGSWLLGIDA